MSIGLIIIIAGYALARFAGDTTTRVATESTIFPHDDHARFDKYSHTYFMIRRHPDLQQHMVNDPGYRWCHRHWRRIVWAVVLFIIIGSIITNS